MGWRPLDRLGPQQKKEKDFMHCLHFLFCSGGRLWPFSMFCGHLQEVLDAPPETLLEYFDS